MIEVTLYNGGPGGTIGQKKGQFIYLNEAHPFVARVARDNDKAKITMLAAFVEAAYHEQVGEVIGVAEDVVQRVSDTLAGV